MNSESSAVISVYRSSPGWQSRIIRAGRSKILSQDPQVFAGPHPRFENMRVSRQIEFEALDQLPPVIATGHTDIFFDILCSILSSEPADCGYHAFFMRKKAELKRRGSRLKLSSSFSREARS